MMFKKINRKRRVVITGLGVISANGIGVNDFWKSVRNGKSGVGKISLFDTSGFPVKLASEVRDFSPRKYFDEKIIKQTARFSQFALIAAKEAMMDAQLERKDYDSEKAGVLIGTSAGGLSFAFKQHEILLKQGFLSMDTFSTSIINPSAAARVIALLFQLKGLCQTFSSTCVAATDAVGSGFHLIRDGMLDVAIVGGTETPVSYPIMAGFYLGRILTNSGPNVPKPFDLKRSGTVLAEGSAILIFEELEHALKRKAKIYAEVAGYASTCDAYHVVIPDPEGVQAVRAMELALLDADAKKEKVDYINAHGTATIKNDVVETVIIKKVFGKRAVDIPISATKSITGHHLGATGAFEALICILALKYDVMPPTINYEDFDPQCDLDYIPRVCRKKKLNLVLSNSFGFGGLNSILVFKRIND